MTNIFGCLNFNCLPPKVNLIIIAIFNLLGIGFDICQLTYFKNLNDLSLNLPLMSKINLSFQSVSLTSSIIISFIRKFMDIKYMLIKL